MEQKPRSGRGLAAVAVEAIGLIVVLALIAVMLLLRWGRHIPWSAR